MNSETLKVVQARPFNAETPMDVLRYRLTPTDNFFVRSNFAIPDVDASTWRLVVRGTDGKAVSLSLAELRGMPSREVTVTVECAGNGRLLMNPLPSGTPWNLGAASTATFRGVPLADVLALVPATNGVEALFHGADGGDIDGKTAVRFERSLPLDVAGRADVLLAYEMNGAALTPHHGFPLRVAVPGYYGVAWVKWLQSIDVIDHRFEGHFQTDRYVYRDYDGATADVPVTQMHVRAIIATHADGTEVKVGAREEVGGTAWSGHGRVVRVETSFDGGATWTDASIDGAGGDAFAAVEWRAAWTPSVRGSAVIMVRATDASGATQPLDPRSNVLGYGNNVVQRVSVSVV